MRRGLLLYADVAGALALSWAGMGAMVAPLLGPDLALVFAGTVDLAAILALHEVMSAHPQAVALRRWAWSVLLLAGVTSLGLNVGHAFRSGLLPGAVALAVGAVPVLLAGLLSHVVALSGHVDHVPPAPPATPPSEAAPRLVAAAAVPNRDRVSVTVPDRPTEAAQPARTPRSPASGQKNPQSAQRGRQRAAQPADPDALMRAYWDREVSAGRVPDGGQLARAGGVSPATGRRRREKWEAELPAHMTATSDSDDRDQVATADQTAAG